MADPIPLPSGALLVLNVAPFEDANALKKAVFRELVSVQADLSGIDLDRPPTGSELLALKNVVFQLLGSEAIDAALWKCMARCIYNNEPATPKAFQPENARQDYQQAAGEVLLANLTPFFSGLLSLLRESIARLPSSPASV